MSKSSSIRRELTRLAIPNILANLATPLLSVTDTALMGHEADENLIGAAALGAVIFNILYWSFGFLRMGATGMTAQCLGRQDYQGTSLVLSRSLLTGLIIAATILSCSPLLWTASVNIMNISADLSPHIKEYYTIRIWAAPATLALYCFHGWFLGMQKSWLPVILTIFSNLTNITVSIYLVRIQDMQTAGIAWGTVIAQYTSLLLAGFLSWKCLAKTLHWPNFIQLFDRHGLSKFFSVNRHLFIRTLLLLAVVSFFTVKSEDFGPVTLAANVILVNLGTLMAYIVDGLAFAAEALSGRFIGEKNNRAFNNLIKTCLKLSFISGLAFAILYWLTQDYLLAIFTGNEEIAQQASQFLYWALIAAVVNPLAFILDGIFIGATATKTMKNVMLQATLFAFLPVYLLTTTMGNNGLWLSMSFFMLTRGLLMLFHSKKLIRQTAQEN